MTVSTLPAMRMGSALWPITTISQCKLAIQLSAERTLHGLAVMHMKLNRAFRMRLNTKRELNGWIFVAPFVIGFALFFLYPLYQSIRFSLSELEIMPGGFKLHFVGWQNYHKLLFENVKFRRVFVNTMIKTLSDMPLILIFSFFAANLLNQKFRGRFFARVIFFLPVIIGRRQ